ncbi:MAG: hypothetical protein KAQ65_00125 [Candidatus Thorarchaeota archaeon]|nr:hypothetical protein [Candidatus Thorarchaeota archaeon]MCK5238350.1 hypothetical protein [Candidatus Thorarchaeota archaeon]
MVSGKQTNNHLHTNVIDSLLTKPPRGYVFLVMAAQESHYDLFMSTLARKSLNNKMRTLNVVTEARNRQLMQDMAKKQDDDYHILEVNYGQETIGKHTCSPHLHEINIMMRSLRNVIEPRVVTFEALTPLLIDFSARDVVQFFKESVEESIKVGSVEFYLLHAETADPVTINQLFSLAQGIIMLTTAQGKNYMTIKKSTGVELPYNPIEYVPSMIGKDRTEWTIELNW